MHSPLHGGHGRGCGQAADPALQCWATGGEGPAGHGRHKDRLQAPVTPGTVTGTPGSVTRTLPSAWGKRRSGHHKDGASGQSTKSGLLINPGRVAGFIS